MAGTSVVWLIVRSFTRAANRLGSKLSMPSSRPPAISGTSNEMMPAMWNTGSALIRLCSSLKPLARVAVSMAESSPGTESSTPLGRPVVPEE